MKLLRYQIITFVLFVSILVTSPQMMLAQTRLMGEVTVDSMSPRGQKYIIINGENILSGRSILSPASIVTPAETSAQISLAKTGVVKISPGSTLNLFFDKSTISGDFWAGKLTLNVSPNTKLSIVTADGTITNSDLSQETVATIDFVDNKVRVQTQSGELTFKGEKIAAGQTLPASQNNTANKNAGGAQTGGSGSSKVVLITLAIVGAVAVAAILGLSGGNDNNNVSPTR